jgi:hypothetical protein
MGFEDRVREAALERQQSLATAKETVAAAAREKNAAADAARAMLPEVESAIAAIRRLPIPPDRPPGPGNHRHSAEQPLTLQGRGWYIYDSWRIEKRGPFRTREWAMFDHWLFTLDKVSVMIYADSAVFTYRTGAITSTAPELLNVTDIADMGFVSWSGGTYRDACWEPGKVFIAGEFERFLSAAAALVASRRTGSH